MRDRIEHVLSLVLTLCGIAIAGSVVYRTFSPVGSAAPQTKVRRVASWNDALSIGYRMGNPQAPVTIVDVADLQCPVCRAFYTTVQQVIKARPGQISLVHVAYPLAYHKQAMQAARGAECAAARGRVAEWVDVMYTKQDSLGSMSWGRFAERAGIRDTLAMVECIQDTVPVRRITGGLAFGEKIGLIGTPTIIINGWLLPALPSVERLTAAVDSIEKGVDPFAKGRWDR